MGRVRVDYAGHVRGVGRVERADKLNLDRALSAHVPHARTEHPELAASFRRNAVCLVGPVGAGRSPLASWCMHWRAGGGERVHARAIFVPQAGGDAFLAASERCGRWRRLVAMDPSCPTLGCWAHSSACGDHHVWAIMLFYRSDYLQAGVDIFRFGAWRSARPALLSLAALLVVLVAAMGFVAEQGIVYWVMAGGFALYNIWGTMQLERESLSPAVQRRRFKTASYSLLCGVFTALLVTTVLTAVQ